MKSSNLKLIPSYIQNQPLSKSKRKPYLFFHIPKSAGMSFSTGMQNIYEHVGSKQSYPCCFVRCDDEKSEAGKQNFVSVGEFFERFSNEGVGGVVVSIMPDKVLEVTKKQPFKFITVLRDPVDRVVSSFGYYCMRNTIDPSEALFDVFIRKEENKNISTKTILGIKESTPGTGVLAAKIIQENFYAYCFVQDLDEMMSMILSYEGLPNLVLGQENKTLGKYRYEVLDAQRTLISELNTEDMNLVATIGPNSKRLPEIQRGDQVHSQTVVVEGDQSDEKYEANSSLVKTSDILSKVSI